MRPLHFMLLLGLFMATIIVVKLWKQPSDRPTHRSVVVINVLDKEQFDDCHIKGSINIPFDAFQTGVEGLNLDKDTVEIIVYCSNYMCTASAYAYKMLKNMGYKNVWAYEGGTAEWHQMGLPIEGPCASSYLQQKIEPAKHSESDSVNYISAQDLEKKLR